VEVAAAYLNPSPQLNTHTNHLPDLLSSPTRNPDPCPASEPLKPRSSNGRPWALDHRLTSAARAAIVNEYRAGEPQKTLARRYGISVSSVKRLLRDARSAG
jgi:hypothetical protein